MSHTSARYQTSELQARRNLTLSLARMCTIDLLRWGLSFSGFPRSGEQHRWRCIPGGLAFLVHGSAWCFRVCLPGSVRHLQAQPPSKWSCDHIEALVLVHISSLRERHLQGRLRIFCVRVLNSRLSNNIMLGKTQLKPGLLRTDSDLAESDRRFSQICYLSSRKGYPAIEG